MATLAVTISGSIPSVERHVDLFPYDLSFAQANYPGSFIAGFTGLTDLISLVDVAGSRAVELRGDDLSFAGGVYNGHVHTITLFSFYNFSVSNTFVAASLTGVNLDIGTVMAVIATPSTTDDLALLRSLLAGNDLISLNNGDDSAFGWNGNDTLLGQAGDDNLYGDAGNDLLNGGLGADGRVGGKGTDTAVYLDAAQGVVAALDGSLAGTGEGLGDLYLSIENLTGSAFADTLIGNIRSNVIAGDSGNDTLWGKGGDDGLSGGGGRDYFFGGRGPDSLELGGGIDRVVYEAANEGLDLVTGFSADDQFQFRRSAFGNLDLGVIDETIFVTGASNAALDGGDRFVFRTTDYSLWYDSDGSGATAPVKMADLQSSYLLQSEQIIIIA